MPVGARPFLVAILASGLLACQGEGEKLAELEQRAETYAEEGKHAEAIISYRNILQIDPSNAEAQYGLAKAFLAVGEPRDAYWALHETVRLDPGNREARLAYSQFLMLAQEFEEMLEQGDALVAGDPGDYRGHLVRGQALVRLERDAEALEAFDRAMEVAPDEPDPVVLLSAYHARRGDREAAEPYFRRRVELDRSFESLAALARFLSRDPEQRHEEEAEALYREALELAGPERRELATRLLASFLYERRRFEEAEQTLAAAIETIEDPLDLIYLLARLYSARGEKAKAEDMLAEATRARPDSADPFLVLSAYRSRQGDLEGALAAAEDAIEADPESSLARLRKAELLVDVGYREKKPALTAQGRGIVDAVLARDPSGPDALFVKAKIDIAEGRARDAADAMRKAVEARPDWARGHFLLGSALLLSGERGEARAELAKALELDAALIEARKLLARVHAALGEHEFAIEEGRRVLAERPDDASLRILVAESLMALRRTDQALAEVRAIDEGARDASANYALARVHLLRGELDEARAFLLEADAQQPSHPDILRSLLELGRLEGDVASAYERIREAVQAEPESATLIQLRGIGELLLRRLSDAERSFKRAIELDANHLPAYGSLATLYRVQGRTDETLATYRRAIEARPDHPPLHLIEGMLLESMGRREESKQAYERAIELDPSLATAKNNLAYLLAEEGQNLDRALDLAQEAKSQLPDNPSAADTLGWVLFKKGIPSAAVGYLREAEGGFPPTDLNLGVVRHHLALAYEANGEPDRARETLERAVQDLDAYRTAVREQTGSEPPDPPWARDVRKMLDRLTRES